MATVKMHEQQKEWVIKAAAGVITCVCCYGMMLHSAFPEVAILRQSIADSQKRSDLYREVRDLSENMKQRERILATLLERSQVLARISDIAGRNQITVDSLTPRSEPDGGYIKMRMDLEGRANFFPLLKFLRAVEKIGPEIKIRDVSVTWKPGQDSQSVKKPLQIRIVFETLLMQRASQKNA